MEALIFSDLNYRDKVGFFFSITDHSIENFIWSNEKC